MPNIPERQQARVEAWERLGNEGESIAQSPMNPFRDPNDPTAPPVRANHHQTARLKSGSADFNKSASVHITSMPAPPLPFPPLSLSLSF